MRYRRADLRFDVVADDWKALFLESALPVRLPGDEDRNTIDERAAGRQHLLDVPFCVGLTTNWEIADYNVGFRVAQNSDNVVSWARRLLDSTNLCDCRFQPFANAVKRPGGVFGDQGLHITGSSFQGREIIGIAHIAQGHTNIAQKTVTLNPSDR